MPSAEKLMANSFNRRTSDVEGSNWRHITCGRSLYNLFAGCFENLVTIKVNCLKEILKSDVEVAAFVDRCTREEDWMMIELDKVSNSWHLENVDGCIDMSADDWKTRCTILSTRNKQLVEELKEIAPHLETGVLITSLHLSSVECNVTSVQSCLEDGDDVNRLNEIEASPLHLACCYGNLEMVRCLLNYEADVNIWSKMFLTPLHIASYNNHLTIAQELIDHGAKLYLGCGIEPLHLAAMRAEDDNTTMVQVLINKGTPVDITDENGATALHYACHRNRARLASVLLHNGANPNAKDNEKFSPLTYLLKEECDEHDDEFYWHLTCDTKHIQILNFLLEFGVEIGSYVYAFTTEFSHDQNSSQLSRSFLRQPSTPDPDVEPWNYDLDIATSKGHMSSVQCLLKAGLKFEKGEWFMDDEWLLQCDYDLILCQYVTKWCMWRFHSSTSIPPVSILNKMNDFYLEYFDRNDVGLGNEKEERLVNKLKEDVDWIFLSLSSPRSLYVLSRNMIRLHLISLTNTCNIFPLINRLPLPSTLKDFIKLSHLPPEVDEYCQSLFSTCR